MTTISDVFSAQVPRYTSYPTAPHFSNAVGPSAYRGWLAELPSDVPLSLYLHIPFCDTLCWFCGCHTSVVNHYAPVRDYCALLETEIALVADLPNDSRFEAYGPNGDTVTLDLGWSYREFSALWMPFAAWKEAGFVFYARGADGQTNLAPATRRELAAIKLMTQSAHRESLVMAFSDVFLVLGAVFLTMVLLVPLVRKPAPRGAPAGGH